MTGRVQGAASTRFEQVVKPGFFRRWCSLHQLDIVLQGFFKAIMDNEFYSLLTGLISYLLRQLTLINEMNTKAQKVADTRWESMSGVASWFRKHRRTLQVYLDEKKPGSCAPPVVWWVFTMFVAKISCEATYTFRSLKGLTTLVSQQREGLLKLHSTYLSWFMATGPLLEDDANLVDLDTSVLSTDKKFSIKFDNVTTVPEDLGNYVITAIDELGAEDMIPVLTNMAACSVELLAKIEAIVCEHDSRNKAADFMPPVLPHQLVKLQG